MVNKTNKVYEENMTNLSESYSRIYFGWDFEKTKRFYKSNPPKERDIALVVSTQANCVTYEIAKINRVNATRIYFDKGFGCGGSSFYYSGKNCWSPKGQTRLIPPVEKLTSYMNSLGKNELVFNFIEYEVLLQFLDEIDARI